MVAISAESGVERALLRALYCVVTGVVKKSFGRLDRNNIETAILSVKGVREWVNKGNPEKKGLLIRQKDIIQKLEVIFGEGFQTDCSVGILLAIDATIEFLEYIKQQFSNGCCGGQNCQLGQTDEKAIHVHGHAGCCCHPEK